MLWRRAQVYRLARTLPEQLQGGLEKLGSSAPLKEALGGDFIHLLIAIKQAEHEACQSVIRSWEREHLLLNV